MPVKLNLILTTGWKTRPDQQQNRGQVLVVQFINEKTNKILFEYAPKTVDKELFQDIVFQVLEKLEDIKILMHKECVTNIPPKVKKITKKEQDKLDKLMKEESMSELEQDVDELEAEIEE